MGAAPVQRGDCTVPLLAVNRITETSENITFSCPSDAGAKNTEILFNCLA